jgi:hypothetical protein
VSHYATDRERVPRAYRDSAELVKAGAAAAKDPLPPVEGEPAPRPEPGPVKVEEPRPGERAPVEAGPGPAAAPDAVPGEAPAPAAPAESEAQSGEPAASEADPRQAELAALERELAARREELKELISESSFDSSQVATNPRLRELAERVPRLQAEVEALRQELER